MNEMIGAMKMAEAEYTLAKELGIGVAAAKEKMKNIGFTYFHQLLEIAEQNENLHAEVETLNVALDASDTELKALKRTSEEKEAKKPRRE